MECKNTTLQKKKCRPTCKIRKKASTVVFSYIANKYNFIILFYSSFKNLELRVYF